MSKQALNTLIKSLCKKHKLKGIEIIVVNNGSTNNTAAGLKKLITKYASTSIEIIPLHLEENMGYPIGVNLGLAKCRGEIITILNNDLIFPPYWFDGLVNTLTNKQDIGAVVPYLSSASGAQNARVNLNSISEIYNFAQNFMAKNNQKIIYSQRIIGACLVLKKEVIDQIGGNDFWFGIGNYDDDDLSIRIALAGYKLAIVGNSFVYHIGTATFKRKIHQLNCALGANHSKFSLKWNLAPQGEYDSRKTLLNNINYNKQKHYFPIKIKDFTDLKPPLIKEPNQSNLLLVADWNNDKSRWKEKLAATIKDISTEELWLWIPKKYFFITKIVNEIKNITKAKQFKFEKINFIHQNITPVDLLNFLNSFDCILTVNQDYVNKYICYLARKIAIPIQ